MSHKKTCDINNAESKLSFSPHKCLGISGESILKEENFGYFHKDPLFALRVLNYCLFVYTFTLSVVLLYVSLNVTIPFLNGNSTGLKYLAWHLFFSVMLNWTLVLRNSSEYVDSSNEKNIETYVHCQRYCNMCHQWIPIRGHHCVLCNKCILKRDHHCYFTGKCIGFQNQRYFVVFCFYVAASCGTGWYFLMLYLNSNFKTFWSEDNYHYLLPLTFIEWSFSIGGIQIFDLFLLTVAWWSLPTFVTAFLYFLQQMFVIVRGQTIYEYTHSIHTYRIGYQKHLQSVFGSYWIVNFVFPMFFIQQEGDGLNWFSQTKEI